MLEDRDWTSAPGATEAALHALRQAAPVELPRSYYDLLAQSDGGEGPLPVQPYTLCLDPATTTAKAIRDGGYFEGFIVFASSGGGELLAFDIRGAAPWPIIAIDMVAGPETAEPVADDFDTLLDLIGREEA